jgi:hypothetical protein
LASFDWARKGEARTLVIIPIEKIVGVERDETSIGMHDVNAGFLDRARVEGIGVDGTRVGASMHGRQRRRSRRQRAPDSAEWFVANSFVAFVKNRVYGRR